jgi:predicted histidine transporter YuiF (NhaC family)
VSWLVNGVRFACEIAAVVAVVWWGWPVLGIVLGVAVIAVWGAWVAPKAKRRLPDPLRLLVELAIFALATVGFAEVGQTALAIVFAVAATTTAGLSRRYPAP